MLICMSTTSSPSHRIYQLHAELCKTLSNPIRLEILNNLREGEKTVNDLVAITGARQATVSQHLAVLRQRAVVTTRKQGSNIFYRVANQRIIEACDMIRGVLFEQMAEMEKLAKAEVGRE